MPQSAIPQSALDQLAKLAKLIRAAHKGSDAHAKATHERFNVFTTLLEAHDEVRLHTRFLHCLLDPKGCHDCGPLFLGLFFDTLKERGGLDHESATLQLDLPQPDESWKVSNEAARDEVGRIDILLEHPRFFGVAIENKIYAAEQELQIARYADYLAGHFGIRAVVLYLTRHGDKSETNAGRHYLRISYADHILTWLEKCLRETYSIVPVNQVILQYRQVVRQLTGKTMEIENMKPITEFIATNPDIIRYRQQINAAIDAARVEFMNKLADGILRGMGDGFQVRLRSDLTPGGFGSHPNGALIITPPAGSPLHDAPFEIWVEHIAKWQGVVVGIEVKFQKSPAPAETRELLQRMNNLMEEHAKSTDYHKADPHVLWDGTEWPTGWHNLIPHPIDDERLSSLLETPIGQTVATVCEGVRAHIKQLEHFYTLASTPTVAGK